MAQRKGGHDSMTGVGMARLWVACLVSLVSSHSSAGTADKQEPSQRFELTVRVNELNNDKGRVAVALFASAADFPDQKHAIAGKLTKSANQRARVTFSDLKPGLYAVAVLHDENENSKMDFNFLGMPLEGYGFSNDASGVLGPPSFEAAAFQLKARASFVPVTMRYFLP